ncbi:MAG: Folate-binding protein YgfZ [Pedosphaera sp.]|nr:Folate-binding protein YgfZ [Pedosphaera sp.]
MSSLALHEFHDGLNARFIEVNGSEVVDHYGDALAEHAALHDAAGAIDLSFRGRICLTGADRVRLLNGQVTNNVKDLRGGEGCYAALVTAKGKLQSDLNIYNLPNELLLDFEPGLTEMITQRLEKYVIADDVQVVDVSPHYGLLSVQGPKSKVVVQSLALPLEVPAKVFGFSSVIDTTLGEIYLVYHPRAGMGISGFDLFVPTPALGAVMDKLIIAAKQVGGSACGWRALEMSRIEAGIPRFGVDMDEHNLASETGIESRAISYSKGCYIGQEVIARIRTYGQVAKALRGLRLEGDLKELPEKGDKLFHDGKEVGYITSALASPSLKQNIALGYVRKEANQIDTELVLKEAEGKSRARIVALPFQAIV